MKRSKFTEEQIIAIMREQGRRAASTVRRRPRSADDTGSAGPRFMLGRRSSAAWSLRKPSD